ncbi:uncharacterized protein TRIADDRAFT_57098 [Trichoplax adhaerens]|uniref:Cilia- and flagella-associated protein 36 n=1 Tax=Trichoplax adhaerens TaxID=10228 RepID=B3S0M0_TRIAD|nr:hypothetical protein TRIADDRAFT_57098 [Trichoplax adhaerens]EDV23663.1 hypothetical protein TRIADDRAFT_57098 [Trichoplax adhaerens]|eukprot:XP_002113189.1 hypothetical protein TRIADDRAFT_57098 [Trichoplax adhaerens]
MACNTSLKELLPIYFLRKENEDNNNSHLEFQVDALLKSFLEDIHVQEEQFVQACSSPLAQANIPKEMLRQIWAADNYEIFKQIMVQKNIELQVQALRLMQQRFGLGPPIASDNLPASTTEAASSPYDPEEDVNEEEVLLRQVIRLSLDEFRRSESEDYSTELDDAIKSSRKESERLLEEARREQEELEKALLLSMKNFVNEDSSDSNASKKLPGLNTSPAKVKPSSKAIPQIVNTASDLSPIDTKSLPKLQVGKATEPDRNTDAGAQWLANAKAEAQSMDKNKDTIAGSDDGDDIGKRRDYFALQRDRLVAKKKAEREKKLDEFTKDSNGGQATRPKSARVARQAISTGKVTQNQAASNSSVNKDNNLAMRVALAQRLKKEVIDKSSTQ